MDASSSSPTNTNTNLEEYSPSSTLITFDTPIPLLRGPLPAGISDDPSSGSYVLAFRDPHAWASSYLSCQRNIVKQCEEGARIGCAISASTKCKPPWWKVLVPQDLKERERCEEREMRECFHSAKDKCLEFGREKCLVPFREARIKGLGFKDGVRLLRLASMNDKSFFIISRIGFRGEFGVTNCRATELLPFDHSVQSILGQRKQGAHK